MSRLVRRNFFLSSLAAALSARRLTMGAQQAAAKASAAWFHRCLVGMEVGPTGAQFGYSDPTDQRYCAELDGRQIVRECVAAHCQYLVMWVRDGDYAYYNSRLLPKAPGLGNRDPLREVVDEAKHHDLPIIAYCVVQQAGHFLKEHPEWEMIGTDGKPLGRFSLRSSGYLLAMQELLSEQLEYGVDGFHIDMLDQGFGPPYGCWSQESRQAFEQEFGRPMPDMPSGPSWNADWDDILEFRYRSSDLFEKALTEHVRSVSPTATVDFNYHGNPPFSWEVGQRPVQHASHGDFVTGETGVWGFSALGVGLNAEFYRASTPGKPYQVAMQRGVRMYHDQTTRPLADIRWELLTLLSHGAFVTMVDKTAFDGRLDPLAYQRIGQAFEEVHRKREHFGQTPIYDAGLYYSSRSRDWLGQTNPDQWMQSFLGAHKALRYEQLGCGIVLDENATLDRLQQHPVIILCNAGILSDREIELLQEYVQHGGGLIVTGHSGQFDRLGQPREHGSLTNLTGARAVERLSSLDNWVRLSHPPHSSDFAGLLDPELPADWSFLVKGPATVYQPTTAQPLGQLLKPHRTTRQLQGREGTEWPMSPESVVGPALLLHRLGQGRVLTFASSPDFATASQHHIVEARRLLTHAVRWLHPNPRVRIEAPTNIQTVVTDDPQQRVLRVHFLGYNSPPQSLPATGRPLVLPGLIEEPPLFRAVVHVRDAFQSAQTLNSQTILRINGIRIELTIHDIHETLVLNY
ncbi:MAG: hypothetical protein KF752_05180 [Pirellulaceae bacterium]|nr:hypothetical protein [Pirellulaceae bacterium]